MILPDDDSVVLDDSDDGGLSLNKHNPPQTSVDDGKGLLPAWTRGGTSPIRDAWLQAWGSMSNLTWARGCFTLDLAESPRFADEEWLDKIWGVYFQKVRLAGEADDAYRARLLVPTDTVVPTAIEPVIAAIINNYTALQEYYLEPAVDFAAPTPANGTTTGWSCFVQPKTKRLLSFYPDKTANPPSYVVPAVVSALFWIVLPTDSNDDSQSAHAVNTSATNYDLQADFVEPITSTWNGYSAPLNNTLLEQIRSDVEQRKAGGVAWFAFIDPLLGAAV